MSTEIIPDVVLHDLMGKMDSHGLPLLKQNVNGFVRFL